MSKKHDALIKDILFATVASIDTKYPLEARYNDLRGILKALLYPDVERSERSVAQNVGLSLSVEQELDIRDQSVAESALLHRVFYARRRSIT